VEVEVEVEVEAEEGERWREEEVARAHCLAIRTLLIPFCSIHTK